MKIERIGESISLDVTVVKSFFGADPWVIDNEICNPLKESDTDLVIRKIRDIENDRIGVWIVIGFGSGNVGSRRFIFFFDEKSQEKLGLL